MDPIAAIIIACIGALSTIVGVVLVYVNTRRTNDLKKIELDQASLESKQEEEARKRKEASEKHQRDMERVAALEAKVDAQDAAMDRLRGKFALLWQHALELNQFIYEGKPPPPPPFPPGLLD